MLCNGGVLTTRTIRWLRLTFTLLRGGVLQWKVLSRKLNPRRVLLRDRFRVWNTRPRSLGLAT